MNIFKQALPQVLKWEGFISDDPNDTGGLTIWGISSKSHKEAVLKMKELIDNGKKTEAFEIATDIYYEVYWKKMGCEDINSPELAVALFDTAVNMGRSMAMKLLKETCIAKGDWDNFLLRRLYTYSTYKQAKLYFRGWANRVLDLWKFLDERLVY